MNSNLNPSQAVSNNEELNPKPVLGSNLRDASAARNIGAAKESVIATFSALTPELLRIENRVLATLPSDAPELTEIARYLLELGGKRIRPVLTLLSSRLFGLKTQPEELIDVSAGIELIHMATLLHDDIIDGSPIRRRQESAFSRFGLSSTLLTGDFLLVKAFGMCARLDRFIIDSTERACVELTEGEILEGTLKSNRQINVEDYLNIIGKKTASLFSLATSVGAHIAKTSEENVERLAKFGHQAGLVFQMVDDILDITADEDLLGKPTGMDLRQKTPSLINILWLEENPNQAKDFFANEHISLEDAQQTALELKNSDIVDRARDIAAEYSTAALQNLNQLPSQAVDTEIREKLVHLIEYTRERCL